MPDVTPDPKRQPPFAAGACCDHSSQTARLVGRLYLLEENLEQFLRRNDRRLP